jgi:NtrC-family two-component system sensor histidine kinase KinB
MIRIRRLETRFFLASCLLVATTIAGGLASAIRFARLSRVVGDTLRESRAAIDLAATLAGALEREDDALLLSLGGDAARARQELAEERRIFERAAARLGGLAHEREEEEAAAALRRHAEAYRAAGDDLLAAARAPDASERYHRYVNPLLREAVADCDRIRELNFLGMQRAGIEARDEAERATVVVAVVSLAALVTSIIVSLHLARAVVQPIREMTASVEAIRTGDFDRRVAAGTEDEIGRLGEGFNRMAEALAEFRRMNLGEVLRAKETLEATLAALPDAVFVIAPDGRVESLNRPARDVLAASGRAAATRLEDLPLSAEGQEAARRALAGEPSRARADLRRAITLAIEGRPRKLLPMAVPIRELAPGRSGAVAILYDVTDFARLDELRTEVVAVASHELKTPLTTLRMNLLLLREAAGGLTAREQEIVATAVVGCEELASTVDELLDLTRIEAGQLRLSLERVELRAAIDQAARAVRARFEEAGIALRTAVEGDEPALVRGDPARLGVVLRNLLDNALKYTPRGGEVAVEASSGRNAGAGGGGILQIAVTDSGPGIAEEFRERVFEKFFRVEHERPERAAGPAQGAGIGLYLCRQIVEAHGGTIRCEAPPGGRGARFVVRLPTGLTEMALAPA